MRENIQQIEELLSRFDERLEKEEGIFNERIMLKKQQADLKKELKKIENQLQEKEDILNNMDEEYCSIAEIYLDAEHRKHIINYIGEKLKLPSEASELREINKYIETSQDEASKYQHYQSFAEISKKSVDSFNNKKIISSLGARFTKARAIMNES